LNGGHVESNQTVQLWHPQASRHSPAVAAKNGGGTGIRGLPVAGADLAGDEI